MRNTEKKPAAKKQPTRQELLAEIEQQADTIRQQVETISYYESQIRESTLLARKIDDAVQGAQKRITALENALKLRNYQVEQIAAALQLRLETSTAVA